MRRSHFSKGQSALQKQEPRNGWLYATRLLGSAPREPAEHHIQIEASDGQREYPQQGAQQRIHRKAHAQAKVKKHHGYEEHQHVDADPHYFPYRRQCPRIAKESLHVRMSRLAYLVTLLAHLELYD